VAFDAYLKIDGIPGESADANHKEWIEILSFSHMLTQRASGSPSAKGGAAAERCDHHPFTIVKALDKASPKLAAACCEGTHIKEILMTLNRAGGEKLEYMRFKLSEAMITSVRPGGTSSGAETFPLEEISFNYGKIEWTYTQQKRADGTGGGKVAAGWNVLENKAV